MKKVIEHYRIPAHQYRIFLSVFPPKGVRPTQPYMVLRYDKRKKPFRPSNKGGITRVIVEEKVGKFLYRGIGHASCSMTEQFCRQTGRELAHERALEALKYHKEFGYVQYEDDGNSGAFVLSE